MAVTNQISLLLRSSFQKMCLRVCFGGGVERTVWRQDINDEGRAGRAPDSSLYYQDLGINGIASPMFTDTH